MISWAIHHKAETVSTNLDARAGVHGDVFTADYQTAGRGRLDHKWLAPPGANLAMSAVLGVGGRRPEEIATLPLVIGLAVVQAISKGSVPERTGRDLPEPFRWGLSPSSEGPVPSSTGVCPQAEVPLLKWPNDVLIGGKKVCGILCERHGDFVVAGIGVNVKPRKFPPELAKTATWLGPVPNGVCGVRDAVLREIGELYEEWREGGFRAVYPEIRAIDYLRGQTLAVRQTDDDSEPVRGVCGGIQPDGSLLVGETPVYAGEAHVILPDRPLYRDE